LVHLSIVALRRSTAVAANFCKRCDAPSNPPGGAPRPAARCIRWCAGSVHHAPVARCAMDRRCSAPPWVHRPVVRCTMTGQHPMA